MRNNTRHLAALCAVMSCGVLSAAVADPAASSVGRVPPVSGVNRTAMLSAAREKRELDAAEALLRRQLDAPLAGSGVLVLREAQRLILRIPARTLFDPDSPHVRPAMISELPWSAVAQLLRRRRHLVAQIHVYSDSLGGQELNQRLSDQRAQALLATLRTAGIAATRLTPEGLGSAAALEANDTPEGRDQNRRVEIVFAMPGV